jgi:hypothetical protein
MNAKPSTVAPRDLAVGAINSPSAVTRTYLTHSAWADFVGEGLHELLVASRNSSMVLARAVTNLRRLAGHVPPDRRSDVSSRIERILAPPESPDPGSRSHRSERIWRARAVGTVAPAWMRGSRLPRTVPTAVMRSSPARRNAGH